ncbi:ABCA1 [Symbiodinium sp. KB8]|nr:ABCA1 [Symbiodinium sp. KB8]
MAFFRHLLLCLWKTWLQKLRNPISAMSELLLPVVLVGVWAFLYANSPLTFMPDATHECDAVTTVDSSTRQDFVYLPRAMDILNRRLAVVGPPELRDPFYAHLESEYPGLSKSAVDALGCKFESKAPGFSRSLDSVPPLASRVMNFTTEQDLENYILSDTYGKNSEPLIYAAVVWHHGPPHWNYTIRMNKTATPDNGVATDPYQQGLVLKTQSDYVSYDPALDQFSQWPTKDFLTVPGFVPIQLAVDRFIVGARERPIPLAGTGLTVYNTTIAQVPGFLAVWNCSFNLPFLADDLRGDTLDGKIRAAAATSGDGQAGAMGPIEALGKLLDFLRSHSLSPQQATLVPFPTASYYATTFYTLASNVFSLSFVLFFFYPVSQMIAAVVHEKESRIKEGMRMMGIPSGALTAAWYLSYFLAFLVCSFGIASIASKNMFGRSDSMLIWLLFWLFGIAATAEAFLISVFFSRAKVASAVGTIIFLASFFPYYAVNDPLKDMGSKVGASFLAPVAFGLDLQVVAQLESSGIGLHWSTIGFTVQGFNVGSGMLMMLADTIIYTLIALYLEQILPSEFDISLPGLDGADARHGDRLLLSDTDEDPAYANKRNFEPLGAERRALKAADRCLTARGLKKHFDTPDGVKKAVDGVDLDVFQGEIFALLGHNGAGKSTTMTMLTGLIPMTSGVASAFGLDVSRDMDDMRRILGVCPQHDVLWPELTVAEHLTFFAAAKGVPPKEVAAAVDDTIKEVGLTEKRKVQSKALSGGMKRKLSVGIALIGGSKVVVLDEPTSGMDPYSRRSTWNILLSSKSDRAIILSTHFLDEADLLGDRIAIMAAGRVRCCGSSMFLKKRYGVGYNLTLNKADEHCSSAPIAAIIRRHVPSVKTLSDVGAEVAFQVPTEASSSFPALFEDLEANLSRLGIRSYSIGATTLEEVFLRVAEEEHHGASGATQRARDDKAHAGGSSAAAAAGAATDSKDAPAHDDHEDGGYMPPASDAAKAASGAAPSDGYLDAPASAWDFAAPGPAASSSVAPAPAPAAVEAASPAAAASKPVQDAAVTHAAIRAEARSATGSVFCQHFYALFLKRLRYALRDFRAAVFQLLIPVLALLAGLLILKLNPTRMPPPITFNTSSLNTNVPSTAAGAAPWATEMNVPLYRGKSNSGPDALQAATPINNATLVPVTQAALDAANPVVGNYTVDRVPACSALLQANIWLWDPTDCRPDKLNSSGLPFLSMADDVAAPTAISTLAASVSDDFGFLATAAKARDEMRSRFDSAASADGNAPRREPHPLTDHASLDRAASPSVWLGVSGKAGKVMDAIAHTAGLKGALRAARAASTLVHSGPSAAWGALMAPDAAEARGSPVGGVTSGGCAKGELPHPLDHAKQFSAWLLAHRKDSPGGSSRFAAFNVTHVDVERQTSDRAPVNGTAGVVLYHNTTANHIIPTMLNIFSSALWRTRSGVGNDASLGSIQAGSKPVPFTQEELSIQSSASAFVAVLFITLAFAFIPASFAVFVVREREVSAKHQQLISGVSIPAYWVATYCWDIANYAVPCILSIVLVVAFDVRELMDGGAAPAMVLLFVLYGVSVAAFTYCISYCFRSHATAQIVVLVLNLLCMVLLIASFIMQQLEATCAADRALRYVYRLLPGYSLGNGLLQLSLLKQLGFLNTDCSKGSSTYNPLDAPTFEPFSPDVAGAPVAFMAVESVAYFALAIVIDILLSFPAIRARLWPDKTKPLETFDEDEDVRSERSRVESSRADSDVIVLDGLRKVYGGEKVAVKQLSFGIGGGQIFGFLGCNGAGKTTTMKILTGDIIPTEGTARLAGLDVLSNQIECRRMLGYCPQFDALLDLLTVREHLELYARIKSVAEKDIPEVVRAKIEEFDLTDFENKLAGSLSGGNKRKLSVAIALISEPPLVVLDEPSTGVDPVARRFMWDVIARYLGSNKTVILVTHSMEEVEALCNKVAIMVGGRLRCLGSIPHLKHRFGRGYMVEIKLDDPDEGHSGRVLDLLAEGGFIVDRDGQAEPRVAPGESEDQRIARLGAGVINSSAASAACDALGDSVRAKMLHPKGSGWALAMEMAEQGHMSANAFADWWAFESLGAHLQHFMTHTFPDTDLVERHGEFFRYSIGGHSSETARRLPLSRIFRALEAGRDRLRISTYSLSQTTLEAVFNSFAAQQDEEQGSIRGFKAPTRPEVGRTHSADAADLDAQLDEVEGEIGDSLLGTAAGVPGIGTDFLTDDAGSTVDDAVSIQ